MNNKSKVEKLEFTDEQQEDIKSTIAGQPSKKLIEYWDKRRVSPKKRKNYKKMQSDNAIFILRRKYNLGICNTCRTFPPLYKVTYDYDGAVRVEYYCNSCFEKKVN